MKWGLIPHWAKDVKAMQINARSETAATTPAFRDSFARKRCVIPADGFYEWETTDSGRLPHWIFRADGYPVGFRRALGQSTGRRHLGSDLRHPHHRRHGCHRSPPRPDADRARSPTTGRPGSTATSPKPRRALALLKPIDDDLWMEREVSTKVNNVRNNGPGLLDPPDQLRLL